MRTLIGNVLAPDQLQLGPANGEALCADVAEAPRPEQFAKPATPAAARAAGFERIETGPMSTEHTCGAQRRVTGEPLNTANFTTTPYRRLE
jgi:hypothetical protein